MIFGIINKIREIKAIYLFPTADLNPSTHYEVDVHAFTKFGAGDVSLPHYLTTNIGKFLDCEV